ncbi:MAG TPA: hypothetical protein VI139_04335, partial [Gemmatimonadales bacterium]
AVAARLAAQLNDVQSWQDFLDAPLALDPDAVIPERDRLRLDALPASLHLYGDRVPIDYEVENGVGVARLRLREGQARRLQPRDVPPGDRPWRFSVVRGKRDAVRAENLEELRQALAGLTRSERGRLVRGGGRRRRR